MINTYRLYLGRESQHRIITPFHVASWAIETVDPLFDAYTVIEAHGVWKGQSERATILEFVVDSDQLPAIEHLASDYARVFKQDAVLLTTTPCTFSLIESRESVAA